MDLIRLLQPHDPSEDCRHHCFVCQVDEPGSGYIRCFECNHLYTSRRKLRQAFRSELIRGAQFSRQIGIKEPFWRSNGFTHSTVRYWWMLLTVRASRLGFCQHCGHDF